MQPSRVPSGQPTSNPTIFNVHLAVQAFYPLDLPLTSSDPLDGSPCMADPQNYRRPDQLPQFPLLPEVANCTVRRALLWCYSQPKWFSGKVHSCTVRFPVVDTFVVNAPFILETPASSKYPVKIILDGSGAKIVQTVIGAKTLVFAANIDHVGYKVVRDRTRQLDETSPDHEARNLAVLQYEGELSVPATKGQPNSLVVANCTLSGFGDSTRDGGTISVSHLQSFGLVDVTIEDSYGHYGGAVSANNVGFVYMVRSRILRSRALSGGGLSVLNATTVYITGSSFSGNKADVIGGAVVLDSVSRAVSMDSSEFSFNAAASFGGSISLNVVASAKLLNNSFLNNRATYGSLAIMASVRRSNITGNTIARNFATYGGGVYWLSKTMGSPTGLTGANEFSSNFAPYGPNFATEATKIVASPTKVLVADYVNRANLVAQAQIQDYYGQVVNDNSSLGSVSVNKNIPKNCGFNNYLAGVSGNLAAIVARGVGTFSYKTSCIPGGNFYVTYSLVLSTVPEVFPQYDQVVSTAGSKQLMADANVMFRTCRVGEKFDFFTVAKDSCSACVKSFSIEDNSDLHVISCRSCPPAAEGCSADMVFLYPGTWRWNRASTTILACPYTNGCIGKNYTGQSSCDKGYHGVMCGICDWTYFPSSDGVSCSPCTGQSLITVPLMILLAALVFGVIIPALLRLRAFAKKKHVTMVQAAMLILLGSPEDDSVVESAAERREKKRRRSWISRYKIFSATYQVIVSSPGTFQVRMGPIFTNFTNAMKVRGKD